MESYPVALAQVVTNLAVNSLQHAFGAEPHDARITLRAWLDDGEEVCIEFLDNGRGIDPALQGKVFEPFFTTRRMLGGSGLGLYIVNQIVTRHLDGSIALHAGPGRGVRFVMRFPRVARHVPDVGRILAAMPRADRHDRR
jgi:signal transduction histidine kinase